MTHFTEQDRLEAVEKHRSEKLVEDQHKAKVAAMFAAAGADLKRQGGLASQMTVREFYAGMVASKCMEDYSQRWASTFTRTLQGMNADTSFEEISRMAFVMADAMIAESNKGAS